VCVCVYSTHTAVAVCVAEAHTRIFLTPDLAFLCIVLCVAVYVAVCARVLHIVAVATCVAGDLSVPVRPFRVLHNVLQCERERVRRVLLLLAACVAAKKKKKSRVCCGV